MIKNKDFFLLLIGRLITNFGDSIYSIASALLVYKISGSSFYSGLALFLTSSTAIVQLIFSPVLDRINIKKFLVLSQLVQAILILIIPILLYFERLKLYHILIIMPIITLINQLVYPGQISILPKILDDKDLIKGNSLMTMAYQGSNAIFDSLSGFLISSFGFMIAFYTDSLTFIICGILFYFLSNKVVNTKKELNITANKYLIKDYIKILKEGISLFKNPKILAIVLGSVFINFSATSITAVLPAFTNDEVYYSLMLSSMGIGVLLGSIASNFSIFKNRRLGKIYSIGITLVGISFILVSFSREIHYRAIVLYAIGWFVIGIINVYGQTMVQVLVPKDKLASAMGAMIGLSTFMSPIGALFGGFIAEIIGYSEAIFVGSLIIIIVAIYWTFDKSISKLPKLDDFNKL